jgi:hypothetical protein
LLTLLDGSDALVETILFPVGEIAIKRMQFSVVGKIPRIDVVAGSAPEERSGLVPIFELSGCMANWTICRPPITAKEKSLRGTLYLVAKSAKPGGLRAEPAYKMPGDVNPNKQ